MADFGRRKGNARLVAEFAAGRTLRDAARASGLSERTAGRRLADPEFRKLVSDVRSEMIQRAVGALASAAEEAIATLRDLLSDDSSTARLGAARSVLEYGTKVRENVELEQRIVDLESRLCSKG